MGCGTSRSQESRPSSPSTPPPRVTSIGIEEVKLDRLKRKDQPEDPEEVELKLFEAESKKGPKSFKALAFAHTKFVQQVGKYLNYFKFNIIVCFTPIFIRHAFQRH